jgi:HK97 family phage major capsid protein
MDLPPGTDSINVPVVTQGSLTGIQTADGGAVATQDMTSAPAPAPVRTIAGQVDAAAQLVEQSPIASGLDQMIFSDLLQDYNQKLDVQVISGSGASGQIKGMLTAAGINSLTYTQASPTPSTHYPVLGQELSNVAKTRFLPATALVMRPERWYWIASSVDANGRPFVLPVGAGPYNALGTFAEGPAVAEGLAGYIHGVPVYIDSNLPNNVGAGTNEDRIIAARFEDSYLFEGPLRTQVNPYVLSGNLNVRFTLYRYAAFTAERYPKSICVTTGTGNIVTTVLAGF